jgi:hypothetical protein
MPDEGLVEELPESTGPDRAIDRADHKASLGRLANVAARGGVLVGQRTMRDGLVYDEWLRPLRRV